MEELKVSKVPMFKSALMNGALLGLVAILFTVITYLTGDIYTGRSWLNWVGILVSVLLLYYFTVKYRNEMCEGYLSYGGAFSYGWIVYFVSGIISVIFMLILQNIIEPDFIKKMAEHQYELLAEKGMSDAQITQALEIGKKFTGPLFTILGGLVASALLGLVISLITAIFAKKNKPVFE